MSDIGHHRCTKPRPKHQHWVPQFYLRYFATPESRETKDPQVWIFSRSASDGDEVLTNVRNVGGSRYLYSPVKSGGERNWEVDELIGSLESSLGQVWTELAADFVDLNEDSLRKGLALFVSVMHLRNPDVRASLELAHRKLVQLFDKALDRTDETPDIFSLEVGGRTYWADLKGGRSYRAWSKNDHDSFFVEFIKSEARYFAELILSKRWSIVFSDEDVFITTDKPVAVRHQSRSGCGIGEKGAVVVFPLSPTRLLVMDDMHDEPRGQYYPLQPSNAGAFNLEVWRGAARFLITGRSIVQVLDEICNAGELSRQP